MADDNRVVIRQLLKSGSIRMTDSERFNVAGAIRKADALRPLWESIRVEPLHL